MPIERQGYLFPDDASEEEIQEFLAAQGVAPVASHEPEKGVVGGVIDNLLDVAKHPIKNAPVIGGTIGGMMGGAPVAAVKRLTGASLPNVTGAIGAATGGGVGEAIRQLVTAALGDDEELATLGKDPLEVAKMIASKGAEQGAYELGGRYLSNLGRSAGRKARSVYEAILKPTKTVMKNSATYGREGYRGAIDELVETGLKENIPVSIKGQMKAGKLIDQISNEIDSIIQSSTKTIDPSKVARRLDDVRGFYRMNNAPQADLAVLDALEKAFLEDPKLRVPNMVLKPVGVVTHLVDDPFLTPSGIPSTLGNAAYPPRMQLVQEGTKLNREIPIQTAQEIKQASGVVNRKSYGELKGAEKEGRKALTRGWKEEIAAAEPAISPLNEREARLLKLEEAIDDALPRLGNRNTFSLTDVFSLLNLPRSAPALAASMANKPALGNRLARVLYRTDQALSPTTVRMLTELARLTSVEPEEDVRNILLGK